jgi:hypothetical protein
MCGGNDNNAECNEEEEDTDEEVVAVTAPTTRPTRTAWSRSAKGNGPIFSKTTFFAALATLCVVAGASVPPCELPLNCGEFNNSKVCGHTFSGCDVCDTCCHIWLKPVDICDGCVQDECTSGRHPDCCVSFECDATSGQCKRAFSTTGAYPNRSACEKRMEKKRHVLSNFVKCWASLAALPLPQTWACCAPFLGAWAGGGLFCARAARPVHRLCPLRGSIPAALPAREISENDWPH